MNKDLFKAVIQGWPLDEVRNILTNNYQTHNNIINCLDEHKRNILFYLNYEDETFDEELFDFFVSVEPTAINQVDKYGNTILLYNWQSCLKVVKKIHAAGVDIRKQNKDGDSVLFKTDRLDVARYLVSRYR